MKFSKFITSKYGLSVIGIVIVLIAVWILTLFVDGMISIILHVIIPIALVLIIYFYIRKWIKSRDK